MALQPYVGMADDIRSVLALIEPWQPGSMRREERARLAAAIGLDDDESPGIPAEPYAPEWQPDFALRVNLPDLAQRVARLEAMLHERGWHEPSCAIHRAECGCDYGLAHDAVGQCDCWQVTP